MSYVLNLIEEEKERQNIQFELIPSENYVSDNVLKALGSCLTNKYAEGYPTERETGNKGRYYGGCQIINKIEQYCCDKWKEVFHTNYHVNVQPHSGSSANLAAYISVLEPGDTILAMDLNAGGHLTHGSPVNFSGKLFNFISYGVNEKGFLDYNDFYNKVYVYKPKMVVIGASAYSRTINFKRIYQEISRASREIAWDQVESQQFNMYGELISDPFEPYNMPYIMVDMSHIAGLIAAGVHPSPFGYADIITTTTHKTLRGPRGGLIFCKPELAKKIDSAVFPCCQGGPLENVIAAKAICAEEALTEEYKIYIENVVRNTKLMADWFKEHGYKIVSDGTDNHLFIIDLTHNCPNLTGKDVQEALEKWGVSVNKQCIPDEKRSVIETSGIRIGAAALTTQGFEDWELLCQFIEDVIILTNLKKVEKSRE